MNPCNAGMQTGPANPDGLQLKSRRIQNGLEAEVTVASKYCAFPGIVNGGIISTLMDCHGNWSVSSHTRCIIATHCLGGLPSLNRCLPLGMSKLQNG